MVVELFGRMLLAEGSSLVRGYSVVDGGWASNW